MKISNKALRQLGKDTVDEVLSRYEDQLKQSIVQAEQAMEKANLVYYELKDRSKEGQFGMREASLVYHELKGRIQDVQFDMRIVNRRQKLLLNLILRLLESKS